MYSNNKLLIDLLIVAISQNYFF